MPSDAPTAAGAPPSANAAAAATRAKVVARFERALGDATLAHHLEIALWNWALRTCVRDRIPLYFAKRLRYRYTTRAQSLEFNLRHPRNPALRERVASRALGLKRLVDMTPQEMFPELWEPVYQRVAVRQLRREAAKHAPAAGSYTCSRCKSDHTVYVAMQIRSADEPMTIFVSCLNCGKNWKD
jgi:transcription elongation factor S-II